MSEGEYVELMQALFPNEDESFLRDEYSRRVNALFDHLVSQQ